MCTCSVFPRPAFDLDPLHLLDKLRNHISPLTSLQWGTFAAHWSDYPSLLAGAVPLSPTSIPGALGWPAQPRCHRAAWIQLDTGTGSAGSAQSPLGKARGRQGMAATKTQQPSWHKLAPGSPLLLSSCFGTCDSDLEQTSQNEANSPANKWHWHFSSQLGFISITEGTAGLLPARGKLPVSFRDQAGTAKPQLLFGECKCLDFLTYLKQTRLERVNLIIAVWNWKCDALAKHNFGLLWMVTDIFFPKLQNLD